MVTGNVIAGGGEVYFCKVGGEGDELFVAFGVEGLSEVFGFRSGFSGLVMISDSEVKSAEATGSIR